MVKKVASDRLTSGTSLKTRRHGNLYEQEFNFHHFHPCCVSFGCPYDLRRKHKRFSFWFYVVHCTSLR